MKLRLVGFFCIINFVLFSQETKTHVSTFDINYFTGQKALHNDAILHLIDGRPDGFIASWNVKTFGYQDWEQRFNYPDYGLSFSYQNLNNEPLGENFALYAHYNFYFFDRNLMLRIGQGLAYNTNPYDRETNFKNIAFGSALMSSTYVMLNYKKEQIFKNFGFQTGLALIHYSNANVKAPNTSVNSITLNVGLTYNLENENPEYISNLKKEKYTEPVKFNLALRSGINQSDVVGSAQYPFYIFSAYADKRVSHLSAFQFGTDVFFSNFLKELIEFQSIAFPELGVSGNEDFKRVGIFVGHELFINKMSLESQLGYYVYYPFDFEGRVYFRVGLKRYFGNKWFGAVTLKSHGAKAEAVEFGIGIRI